MGIKIKGEMMCMDTIVCENKWCIHYQKSRCTFDEIEINSYGMCADCVMRDPDETELKRFPRRMLDTDFPEIVPEE